MDNCIIVCSRPVEGAPDSLLAAAHEAFVIAVDGGMDNLRELGIQPAVWVGDGDSLNAPLPKGPEGKFPRVKLPRSKDYSDLEFALNVAGEHLVAGSWDGDVILLGAQGGRFDHDVINMVVVQNWLREVAPLVGARRCPEVVSIGEHGVWIATMREAEFRQPKGRLFSVFTLDPELRVTITGARYNIKNEPLGTGARGLSNEGLGKDVKIVATAPHRAKVRSRRRSDRELCGPVFVVFPEV